MNWVIAGLIAGVGAFLADWLMWSKVVNKGLEPYGTMPSSPEDLKKMMGPNLLKSGVLALIFGVLFAWFYARLQGGLWVTGGGPLAGMEFATVLWLPTIALSTIGGGVWFDKVRKLNMATFWAWLVRMNVAGVLVGLLVK
ncbi:MAG TPA: hypothetical protein VH116_08760 [Gemmatimonadales bacterium]|jgi:hypothetical protein|nr:hypothetical protein [Gemmatimonadales bacterium]